jgi:hypothetical protein
MGWENEMNKAITRVIWKEIDMHCRTQDLEIQIHEEIWYHITLYFWMRMILHSKRISISCLIFVHSISFSHNSFPNVLISSLPISIISLSDFPQYDLREFFWVDRADWVFVPLSKPNWHPVIVLIRKPKHKCHSRHAGRSFSFSITNHRWWHTYPQIFYE